MKKRRDENHFIFPILLSAVTILAMLFILPMAWADEYNRLEGCWQCQEDGEQTMLEFKSRQQLLYNGEGFRYRLSAESIRIQEESEFVDYAFMFEGDILIILSPYASVMQCRKTKKAPQTSTKQKPGKQAAPSPKTEFSDPSWPPPYVRPQGLIDENNPSPALLLYKFAGRWDYVTGNTLTNLFLKPDGTYEEAYEAGYSGVFKDQGGYQTGHWGATGSQQERGRWKADGSLREGKLYLINQNGEEIVYHYQVHIKGGEVYWGEYFFNGRF
jgi:hypothetical protein